MFKFFHTMRIFEVLLLTCFLTTEIAADENPSERPDTLYFGFFFNDTTASSMKTIADTYFNAIFSSPNIPEFTNFLQNISSAANVTNPHELYTKPVDPNSGDYDPLYHVTAKYCGEDQETCSEYEKTNSKFIDTTFQMNLIGFVLTAKTFGIRVNLTEQQEQLFVDDTKGKLSSPGDGYTVFPSPVFALSSSLPGEIKLEPQPFPPMLPVTTTRAHVTLGCAPGVSAVVTGYDALDAIQFEINDTSIFSSWNIKDPMDDGGGDMKVTLFKPTTTSPPSEYLFVIYPRVKAVANATLAHYYQPSSFSEGIHIIGRHNFLMLWISSLLTFSPYFQ